MEHTRHSSRRLLWTGVGAIIIVLLVVLIALLIMMGTKKDTTIPTVSSANTSSKIASKDEVKQDLAKVDAAMKQFLTDQASAKTAQVDNTNQIKVGN